MRVKSLALLSKHTSSAASVASLDRYAAIHSFFTRPQPLRPFVAPFTSVRIHPTQNTPALKRLCSSSLYRELFLPKYPGKGYLRSSPLALSQAPPPAPLNYDNYPRFFRRLAQSLPHIHRPTLQDFLNASSSAWQRTRIRVRWFFIRNFRKFNADDISAFITWFLMSWGAWVLIGTTTFASVVFAVANSLRLQEYLARALSDYLTAETGVTIIFESAIVPKWKDSRISFKNVFITRRPLPAVPKAKKQFHYALNYDVGNHPANHLLPDENEGLEQLDDYTEGGSDEIKWMTFDLNVDSVDVTLSLWRWLDGKGLIESASVKGVRGVLDRRHVTYPPNLNPADFRRPGQTGAFHLESLQMEDVLLTVYQPGGFRPYTFSIFRADMGTLRQRWLIFDLLRAENIVGQFDNCLFSLHRPQSIGRTNERESHDAASAWSGVTRLRIDGVNIDHVQAASADEGPISWITSGKLDAVLDLRFPRDPEEVESLDAIILDALNAVTEHIPGQKTLAKPPLVAPSDKVEAEVAYAERMKEARVVIDIDLRFRDVKAALPLWANELSYTSNALVRPIVAFMNSNRTLIPIHCRVTKSLDSFDGAWTLWETGLMGDIAQKVYDALAFHVTQVNFNHRVKTVGLWSLQKTAGAVLSALRQVVDPASVQLRELYSSTVGAEDIIIA
ncbi:mitochondrial distribution and morphology proteins-domain-containing protein [Vararia minispora EC-137]|uniref:Mitochondrial distribution and morphology proteins-domain-containing protein n=1 Tax=Vararia minispora EC-137 TaxID=1314806 RepID=A0ACB8QK60_9AGAM|nr:mitochondrial distribution and morphology proteins-domain-containing protein [Vararia minispora EC-137]